ncbi:hypothetical protein HDV06_001862 [Boothiomyces sp. JEL0866]|nr:hypothetical protein HDV06_001862 [Boothiomyces sp. JEL0866]
MNQDSIDQSHKELHNDGRPERKFPCPWSGCGKHFMRKTDVTRHLRIHLNDRPFKCVWPDCGKAFMQRSAVKIHYRTHTGEKPNLCPFEGCTKAFNDTSSLARHRRTHHFAFPFPCSFRPCQEHFATRKLLNEHERTVHNSQTTNQGFKPVTNVQTNEYSEFKRADLPTPQITPESTPRHSPPQDLTGAFRSYIPPYNNNYNSRQNYYPVKVEAESFEMKQQEYSNSPMNLGSIYEGRESDQIGSSHRTLSQDSTALYSGLLPDHSYRNNSRSPEENHNQMLLPTGKENIPHSENENLNINDLSHLLIGPDQSQTYQMSNSLSNSMSNEFQLNNLRQNDMNIPYNRVYNQEAFAKVPARTRPQPPRINTEFNVYHSQPHTAQPQFLDYSSKPDDRRFSASLVSPLYPPRSADPSINNLSMDFSKFGTQTMQYNQQNGQISPPQSAFQQGNVSPPHFNQAFDNSHR